MSAAAPSSSPAFAAERFAAPTSPHAQAFDDPGSCFSRLGSSPLRKHMLNRQCHPALLGRGSGREHTLPDSAKGQKVVKTSFNESRNPEVSDYMNKKMLDLARATREVYNAKMEYQRLRIQELEMMKTIVGDELEETQGHLNQVERQIGQIRMDLSQIRSTAAGGK